MDGEHFDRLTRTLRTPGNRRRLLGALALVGGLIGGTLDDEESAAKRPRHGRQAGHRPGKDKDNRTGKRKGKDRPNAQTLCERQLKGAGCTQGSDGLTIVWTCPENADLNGADLSGCNLIGANLRRVLLNDANLNNAIMNNAHLDGAQLHEAHLVEATCVQCTAVLINLGGADLKNADLRFTDFTSASFNSAWLGSTRLEGAILEQADLRDAHWSSTYCPDGKQSEHFWGDCCGHLNGYHTPNC
jgi:hypothetical protein